MKNPNEEFVDVGYHYQLTLNHIIEHASKLHPKEYVVYRDIRKETYKEAYERCKRLSNALRIGCQKRYKDNSIRMELRQVS